MGSVWPRGEPARWLVQAVSEKVGFPLTAQIHCNLDPQECAEVVNSLSLQSVWLYGSLTTLGLVLRLRNCPGLQEMGRGWGTHGGIPRLWLEYVKVSLISPCSFIRIDSQVARNNRWRPPRRPELLKALGSRCRWWNVPSSLKNNQAILPEIREHSAGIGRGAWTSPLWPWPPGHPTNSPRAGSGMALEPLQPSPACLLLGTRRPHC